MKRSTRVLLFVLGLLLGMGAGMVGCQAINGLGRDLQSWTAPNVPADE